MFEKTRKFHHCFLVVLIPLVLLSCHNDDDLQLGEDQIYVQQLEEIKDKDQLLLDYELQNEEYVFRFEQESISIPSRIIDAVENEEDMWLTKIIFIDGTVFSVPAKRDSSPVEIEDITLNPSGINPLAATVSLRFPAAGRVKLIVHGKSNQSGDITHLFQEFRARQKVPVLGLYEDFENKVSIIYADKEGNERGRTQVTIKTEALNLKGFPEFHVNTKIDGEVEPGMNLISYPGESEIDTSTPYMVDNNGDLRWILLYRDSPDLNHFIDQIGLKRTKKGTYISGDMHKDRIVEFDVLGNVVNEWSLKDFGYSFHHEITEAENGNFLITITKDDAKLDDGTPRIYDYIIEFDPDANRVVYEWDLAEMLDISRIPRPDDITPEQFAPSPGNWGQNNSVTENGNDILATMRFQGVFNYSRSGKLKWIISPHKNWSESYHKSLLNPLDKTGEKITDQEVVLGNASHPDFEWSWGPHTPVDLPNGNILVFDNGYNRHFINNSANPDEDYSRIVEYKVDEKNKTVQQVWSYGKERGKETFSHALSGVQYLTETGNVLFYPGTQVRTTNGRGGRIVEINRETNKRVFELEITVPGGRAFHRATRLKLYPENL